MKYPAQDPLLVGIGSKVVRRSAVTRHVEEEVRVLRRRVFGSVRCRVAHDQQEGLILEMLPGFVQEPDRVVGDQIRIVVGVVVEPVLDLHVNK